MVEKITITSPNGKSLAAAVHYPDKVSEKLAILCPGYLDSKDYQHLINLAEDLAEQGYTVIRFDPMGTWKSEGDISDYITTQYLEDIKNVLEYMLQQTDYKHVLLGGHSRGGMVSILYAARDPRISLVLGIMPSSGRTMAGGRREEWKETGFSISKRDLPENRNGKREYRVPYSHVEDRDKYNVVEDVKQVKVPIILIAGELDELVLPEYVKEIFDEANEPKRMVIIEGIGHDYRHNLSEIKKINKTILNLLTEDFC